MFDKVVSYLKSLGYAYDETKDKEKLVSVFEYLTDFLMLKCNLSVLPDRPVISYFIAHAYILNINNVDLIAALDTNSTDNTSIKSITEGNVKTEFISVKSKGDLYLENIQNKYKSLYLEIITSLRRLRW